MSNKEVSANRQNLKADALKFARWTVGGTISDKARQGALHRAAAKILVDRHFEKSDEPLYGKKFITLSVGPIGSGADIETLAAVGRSLQVFEIRFPRPRISTEELIVNRQYDRELIAQGENKACSDYFQGLVTYYISGIDLDDRPCGSYRADFRLTLIGLDDWEILKIEHENCGDLQGGEDDHPCELDPKVIIVGRFSGEEVVGYFSDLGRDIDFEELRSNS